MAPKSTNAPTSAFGVCIFSVNHVNQPDTGVMLDLSSACFKMLFSGSRRLTASPRRPQEPTRTRKAMRAPMREGGVAPDGEGNAARREQDLGRALNGVGEEVAHGAQDVEATAS